MTANYVHFRHKSGEQSFSATLFMHDAIFQHCRNVTSSDKCSTCCRTDICNVEGCGVTGQICFLESEKSYVDDNNNDFKEGHNECAYAYDDDDDDNDDDAG